MDADRFDRIAVSLTGGKTRRGTLAAIAASLGGLLGWGAGFDADARKKKKKKRKKCKGGKTKCNGKCRDLSSNDNNCGSCGNVCPQGSTCTNGSCENGNGCPDECCSNNDCPGTEVCQNGNCVCPDECCSNDDCPGLEICQNGSCACVTECCDNGDCPTGGTCNQQTGQCVCPGNCCFDNDCPQPNQVCLNVNNQYNCFCNPQLVCGQVCCQVGQTCTNPQTSTCS